MLDRHPTLRTRDLDEARDSVGRIFAPHRLTLVEADTQVDLTINSLQHGSLGIYYVDYGAHVFIEPGELTSFYLVQMPLAGSAWVRCGNQDVLSTPTVAAVPNATEALEMSWSAGTPQLVLYVPRHAVERAVVELTGSEVTAPVRFHIDLDLATKASATWRQMLEPLVVEAEAEAPLLHPSVRAQLECAIVLSMLTIQPSNYSEVIDRRVGLPTPSSIRRAMTLCQESPDEPLTVSDLAAKAGLSVRALQAGFQRYVGMSPMRYLRTLRLRAVHQALLDDPLARVSDVACRWGFTNPGRFAREYREAFGELPSQTLARNGRIA